MIELSANLIATDADHAYSFPFSYYQAFSFHALLFQGSFAQEVVGKVKIETILSQLQQMTQLSSQELLALSQDCFSDLRQLHQKTKLSFQKSHWQQPKMTVLPEGNVEKLAILLDMERDIGELDLPGVKLKALLEEDLLLELHEHLRETIHAQENKLLIV